MAAKPQRRTLVKSLGDLVYHVNWSVFNAMSPQEMRETHGELLKVVAKAEAILKREREAQPTPSALRSGSESRESGQRAGNESK